MELQDKKRGVPAEKPRPDLGGLVEMSNRYGSDPQYVLAGGGNSSMKDGRALYIKSSGTSLATIAADGFTGLDRDRLNELMNKRYDARDERARDAEVISDMMDARIPGYGNLRPSVETLLHHIFPYKYVLHLHPALVNGMTCASRGRETAREIFGGEAVWVPEYKPGYELAKLCEKILADYMDASGIPLKMMFLQNHGVFVAADEIREIDELYARIMGELDKRTPIKPVIYNEAENDVRARVAFGRIAGRLSSLPAAPSFICHYNNSDVEKFIDDADSFKALSGAENFGTLNGAAACFGTLDGAFTPDHIVYCKSRFLYVKYDDLNQISLSEPYSAFTAERGYAPRVICVKDVGAVICAESVKDADNALALFIDAVKIAVFSQNFGGPRYLSTEMTGFIENWELEHYRQKIAQS